jgi:hypothetical protein
VLAFKKAALMSEKTTETGHEKTAPGGPIMMGHLKQLRSSHDKRPMQELTGAFVTLPRAGQRFGLLAISGDDEKSSYRVQTTPVLEVLRDGPVYTFQTVHSRYELTVLGAC